MPGTLCPQAGRYFGDLGKRPLQVLPVFDR
jgi:hypothetical protein